MKAVSVANISIRQFGDLYSLNDLHKASGGQDKHSPRRWLQNKQTADLIAEIEIDGIPSIQKKQGLGTFVSKELVVHYGMWISPAFSLKVIRAFLDTQEDVSGSPKLETQTTIDERRGLVDAVKLLVARCGIDYSAAYRMVHQRFGVAHIDQIAAPLLPAAVAYVHSLVLQGRPLVDEVELETVPKLFRHQANLPFDLNDEGRFDVTVHDGKIYRHRITYSRMNFIDEQIPCLRHQVSR